MLIHFVGGLGQHDGRPLEQFQLDAIASFRYDYPNADILLHTSLDSWLNSPTYCKVLRYEPAAYNNWWGTGPIQHGAHMADKLRTDVLMQFGGLYADTDVYSLKPYDFSRHKQLYATPISAGYMFNCIQYVPDHALASLALHKIKAIYTNGTAEERAKWDILSCRKPRVELESANLLEPLDILLYKHEAALFKQGKPRMHNRAYIFIMTTRAIESKPELWLNPPVNTRLEHLSNAIKTKLR